MMKEKRILTALCSVLVFSLLSVVRGDDLTITSFGGNGKLIFDEIANAENYRVEWAPEAGGPWYSFEGSDFLNEIVPTGSGSVTNRVPMFYRVVATTNALPPRSRNMVPIPSGTNSGTDPEEEAYSLTVDSFYMDATEVSNDDIVQVMQWAYDAGKLSVTTGTVQNLEGDQRELLDLDALYSIITWDGSSFGMKEPKGSGYPCVFVSWYGAAAYCNYRSVIDERTPCYDLSDWSCDFSQDGYRLPTSTEWEYAARGGLTSKRFPWGDTITHDNANYYSSASYPYDVSTTTGNHPDYQDGVVPLLSPIGSFAANGYGVHDIIGNAYEWCHDGEGIFWYLYGGCWDNPASGCSQHFLQSRHATDYAYGFRTICR